MPHPFPPPTRRVRPIRDDGVLGGWHLEIRGVLPASRERVFDELTLPERIRDHPGVKELVVLQDGAPVAHGPGVVREVLLPAGRFTERVISWDPPRRLTYAVEDTSAPITHEGGTLELTPVPGGTEVFWRSSFRVHSAAGGPVVGWWAAHLMADDLAWHLDAVGAAIRGVQLPKEGRRLAWVLVPLGLWNVALAPYLPGSIGSDVGVPGALLLAEHVLRGATVLGIAVSRAHWRVDWRGWTVLAGSLLVYFASWLPLLVAPSTAGQLGFALAPAATPLLFVLTLAVLARSRWLAAVGTAFWLTHMAHQLWI